MRIYDVTLPITTDMPVWPGDASVVADQVSKMADGEICNVTKIAMSVHTGTHVDAPYHFLEDGGTVDQIPLKLLTGRAYVVDLPDVDLITEEVLEAAEIPPRTRRVLFKTRNSEQWANGNREFNPNYVALTPEAASILIQRGVKLVGVDYLSVAPYEDPAPTHQVLLGAGVVILEGLDLSEIAQGRYTLYCLPLKIAGADGAPARAMLVGV